jgi:hypothetical protein
MIDYSPNTLPNVNAVEVLDLRGKFPNRLSEYADDSQQLAGVQCDAKTVELIAASWRSLVSGQPARCHMPPFGIRFIVGSKIHLQVSICWRCHNMYGLLDGSKMTFAFDSEAPAAKTLLSLCMEVIGVEQLGDE